MRARETSSICYPFSIMKDRRSVYFFKFFFVPNCSLLFLSYVVLCKLFPTISN
jgi:hypothetical protein